MDASKEPFELSEDGLIAPEVGPWAEDKHRLVALYSSLFSSGMKGKWDNRVYLELYAGAGYARIRGSGKLIAGSPLRAIQVSDRFDKYVFCEEVPEKLSALKKRVSQLAPAANVGYIEGKCDFHTDEILAAIPHGSRDSTVLTLCFADPFDIGLKFETIRALADNRYVDFVITLALGMDANRNYEHYVKEDASKIDEFLGSNTWRQRWATAQWDAVKFTRFLADEFTQSMAALRYIPPPFYTMKEVRSHDKNLRLYRLALFSRHERAYKFWDQVLKYETKQQSLFD
jgi:three-Cys-motif partner protein